jgi:hypothetical protein
MIILLPKHTTQLDNLEVNDCAWACFDMDMWAYRGYSPGIRALATRYGAVNKFTTVAQLVNGQADAGIPSAYTTEATWEWYLTMWSVGYPITTLAAMHVVTDNDGFTWAHWLKSVGYENGQVVVHNPLKRKRTTIPEAEFRAAISERSRYVGGTNSPHIAVYPKHPLRLPKPQSSLIDALKTVAKDIHVEASQGASKAA